jgi:large subunit ribosomal protein L17
MRHHRKIKSFDRDRKGRVALMRALAVSLVRHGAIVTTEAKAKALRPAIEKLVTHARTGTLSARRLVAAKIGDASAAKLIKEVAPKYGERKGGYTRITKLPIRASDAAKMAQIEFV